MRCGNEVLPAQPSLSLTHGAKLNLIAAQMRHEDELIGLRMSWLVISQSFLFGTFATLVGLQSVVGTAADAVKLLLIPSRDPCSPADGAVPAFSSAA